jgi:hypothetical protein
LVGRAGKSGRLGYIVIYGIKGFILTDLVYQGGVVVLLTSAVGRITRSVKGSVAGWAKYAPLRRGIGGAAWTPPVKKKIPAGSRYFFSLAPPSYGWGAFLPL